MITFRKTKPLVYLLKELPIGKTIVIPNTQARLTSVRDMVAQLRKEGFEFKATVKGLTNKIAVTKLSNNSNNESI